MYEYNSTLPQIKMGEYGRNFQNIVAGVCELPTRELRNEYAVALVEMMAQMTPAVKEQTDYKQKLWNTLFAIADYKLDADSPFEIVKDQALVHKRSMAYPRSKIKIKHYGKTVETMMDHLKTLEDEDARTAYLTQIANFMKMAYLNWNKDHVTDEQILTDLKVLSGGELALSQDTSLSQFTATRSVNNGQQNQNRNKNRRNGNNNSNNNGNNKNNKNKKQNGQRNNRKG